MKIALVGILNNPVRAFRSHNAGQTYVIKKVIESKYNQECEILTHKDDWNNYDILFITEGVNFTPGQFNLFGGVTDQLTTRLKNLHEFKGKVYSTSGDLDYNILIEKREALHEFNFTFKDIENFDISNINNKLALGDSHILSAYKPGYGISKNNAKTLRGFLKKGLRSYVSSNITDLIFYAGNIDIRFLAHNPNRKETPTEFICETIKRLESQLLDLKLEKITCIKLIPIEDISRRIPKADQIDGLNFYGSFEERQNSVNYFNTKLEEMCIKNNFQVNSWNFNYSEPLDFNYMESIKSVHIRPSSYMNSKDTENIF